MTKRNAPAGISGFRDLQLSEPLISVLEEIGYETPTPIQNQAIPHLLKGLDLLGHAPTGTGKTAAFALPLLSRIDIQNKNVQVMVLTPTRELAIQVAEAFQRYASHIKGFHVLPVYGGQDYTGQIRQLKRGVHVVVGTPGRIMDHMRKGTLKLGGLQALVLDEADEMLRMGFIEDVEWILEQTPKKRQMALFSATMPKEVERIARRHLNDPQEISIKAKTATAETIRQRFWQVSGFHKLDALTRILEVEPFDAVLIFVRTKTATAELAERLEARGYAAAAMNGDMAQKQREQMIERLKKGSLDILVATDVAARGLDVDRISHVVNFDIPYDTEAYIHRIGRTGRAGRHGDAILFVAPREKRMLFAIEKATRQKIEQLVLPTTETVNNKRIAGFKQKITDTLAGGELAFMQGLVEQYRQEHDVPALEIAAALAKMSIGDKPMLLSPESDKRRPVARTSDKDNSHPARDRIKRRKSQRDPDEDKDRYRIEVGHKHGVKPGNIVGAIANEAGLDGEHIGHIEIEADFSLVDLPVGMPKDIFMDLKKVRVCGEPLKITRYYPKKPPRIKNRSKKKK
ncbi:MAG: DEAD/DEAH box helicase [Gammaproteobacteria bacterium]|nr:DEAD/DEAH box helicase [Gammaproteobacteria bacterium]MDH4315051.1 DEAD/DEAH box helicase [Gammaproteobacteria bacterium]MDH5214042.1 DEAD/DEAH box helicase [Gammaproteobacteria bacterium]MDH5499664.1 DEAD/DEAH box helicase [Gammaproteobacteria bacterium]